MEDGKIGFQFPAQNQDSQIIIGRTMFLCWQKLSTNHRCRYVIIFCLSQRRRESSVVGPSKGRDVMPTVELADTSAWALNCGEDDIVLLSKSEYPFHGAMVEI